MNRRLADLTRPVLADAVSERSILIQPIGAIEQHGPHLPFSTDLVIPQRAAEALVDKHGDALDLWLLPPIAYSKSNEHAWAPGTIWLSARTLLSVIEDVGRSLATLPARKLVFLNGHGGNSALLQVACRELRLQHGWMSFLMHPMVPPDQGGESAGSEDGMGIHGGHLETSLMMFLAPDLAAPVEVAANLPSMLAGNRHVRFGGPVTFGWTSQDFGREGHIGDPSHASAEIGRSTFEAIVANLAEAMSEVARFQLPTG